MLILLEPWQSAASFRHVTLTCWTTICAILRSVQHNASGDRTCIATQCVCRISCGRKVWSVVWWSSYDLVTALWECREQRREQQFATETFRWLNWTGRLPRTVAVSIFDVDMMPILKFRPCCSYSCPPARFYIVRQNAALSWFTLV